MPERDAAHDEPVVRQAEVLADGRGDLAHRRLGARAETQRLGHQHFSVYLNGGTEEELALDFWVEAKGPHDPDLRMH